MSTGLKEKTCEILRRPMASFTRRGPGGNFSYHKGSDVIVRLNEAFNHTWSSEKLEVSVIEDQVLMLVSINVYLDGDLVTHQGYGSADIARSRSDNKIVNIGNTYKSAFTNALKKAAEQFGIGLEDDEVDTKSPIGGSGGPSQGYSQPAAQRFSAPVATATNNSRPPMERPGTMPDRSSGMPPRSGGVTASAANVAGSLKEAAAGRLSSTPPLTAPSAPSAPSSPPMNPAPMSKPEIKDDLVSSVQEHALQNLANMKNLSEAQLVMGALPKSGKVSFKELLRSEASEVIKYANVQPQGNS